MKVTNQNLIVRTGGSLQTHYPIWVDDAGVEYIPSRNGQTFVRITSQVSEQSKREVVERK
jgi:hypothetical protein